MACKSPDNDYTVVEELADVSDALAEIRCHDLLAMDCEGVDLSRAGELTVLTIATPIKSYIFDILKLGKHVFDDGLRDLLEDQTKEKLMFDCRGDADSLQHQFKVHMSGVLDLQLLEVMHRRKSPSASASSASGSRRSTQTDDVENVNSFLCCTELYMDNKQMTDKKKTGKTMLKSDKNIWKIRPLSDTLKDYCCVDASGLFILYEKLKVDGDVLPRLRIASDRYADYFRSMPERTYGMFEKHDLLPLDIIPDVGSLNFPFATTKCVGCHRRFPRKEFSKTQLRNGEQKCRVCKAVKLRDDREKSWIWNSHTFYENDCSLPDDDVYWDLMEFQNLLRMRQYSSEEMKKETDKMLFQYFFSRSDEDEFDPYD